MLLCVEASGEARSWGLTSRARGVVPPWVQRLCEVSRFSVALVWLTVDATYVLHVFVGFGFHFLFYSTLKDTVRVVDSTGGARVAQ